MTTRIGIIGGGQLARMMGEPARRLGFYVTVLDPTPEFPPPHHAACPAQ